MINIQKMIDTTLSVRVRDLTRMMEPAKPIAASSATTWPTSTWSSPGRTMITTPTTPRATAATRAAVILSPRRHDREQRDPYGPREFDRNDFRDWNHRDREEPEELRHVVHGIAGEVAAEVMGSHRTQAAGGCDHRHEEHDAEKRAELHDLEHVQHLAGLPRGDRQRHHGGEPAGHPEGGEDRRAVGTFAHGCCGRVAFKSQVRNQQSSQGRDIIVPRWPRLRRRHRR